MKVGRLSYRRSVTHFRYQRAYESGSDGESAHHRQRTDPNLLRNGSSCSCSGVSTPQSATGKTGHHRYVWGLVGELSSLTACGCLLQSVATVDFHRHSRQRPSENLIKHINSALQNAQRSPQLLSQQLLSPNPRYRHRYCIKIVTIPQMFTKWNAVIVA